MEFVTLLSTLTKVLLAHGPAALGWVVSAVLGWAIVKKKKSDDEENNEIQEKLLKTKDEYVEKVQEMNDKLTELNSKHAEIVSHISEKRVEDLKELTEDYNKLATNTLLTLDRFVIALEVSNKVKGRLSGDGNDE